MANWRITKYRACDGSCCVDSPRFPTTGSRFGARPNTTKIKGADCIYHLNEPGTAYGGCLLHKTPRDKLITILSAEELDLFTRTCLNWPLPDQDYKRVYTDAERAATDLDFGEGICCHRWERVDGD